jgi:hypothetical protein
MCDHQFSLETAAFQEKGTFKSTSDGEHSEALH